MKPSALALLAVAAVDYMGLASSHPRNCKYIFVVVSTIANRQSADRYSTTEWNRKRAASICNRYLSLSFGFSRELNWRHQQ